MKSDSTKVAEAARTNGGAADHTYSAKFASHQVKPKVQQDLFAIGKQLAETRGAFEAQVETVEELKAFAEAVASDVACEAFDVSRYEHDRLLQSEYEKKLKDREDIELSIKFAAAELRDNEEELARACLTTAQPAWSFNWLVSGVGVLTVSLAPTLHDFIFISLSDDILNWLFSAVVAGCISIFIAYGILTGADFTEGATKQEEGD